MAIFNTVYGGKGGGWKPGADTVAYWKFDNDLTDSSGNGHNITLSTGSISYGTASGGGKYAYWNSSTYSNNLSFETINYDTDSYTVSFYWQPKSLNGGCVFDWSINGSDPLWLRVNGSIAFWDGSPYSASVDTWYHIVLVRTTNSASVYVNGNLHTTYTKSQSGTRSTTFRFNSFGNSISTNNNYLGEFIVEKKAWSATEVSDYYNQTKSNYGL